MSAANEKTSTVSAAEVLNEYQSSTKGNHIDIMTLQAKQLDGQPVTMTSIELLEVVNQARALHGEGEIRRNDFTARCKDELDGEYYETFVVKNPRGPASEVIRMTRDQCMYVLMRESKVVRRTATAQLNKLESSLLAIPQTMAQALRLAADQAEQIEVLAIERDHAIATKAQISSKREATAMATASTAKKESAKLKDQLGFNSRHATVKAVEKVTKQSFQWRPLKKWCDAHGVASESVEDKQYGFVKAWPTNAWNAVHGIDLAKLFGLAVAA